ncbi:MAG TPA: hypothetical protein VII99_01460, partial [Bacteroidia bacterium]
YYYEKGGDTFSYHSTSVVFVNLLLESPLSFLKVLFFGATPENYYFFNSTTGYPYFWTDHQAFNVSRFDAVLELFAFKSYLVASILMAVVSFSGIWKLYCLFCELFPSLYRYFSFSILFIPSLIFWGSGLLKDSWTLSAACWFCVSFYRIFLQRKNIVFSLLAMLVSAFILIAIKPYIFIGMLPGCLLWMVWSRMARINNFFVRILAGPFVVAIGISIGVFVWINISSNLGEYSSLDNMLKKANVASEDLKQGYYQGNSFDLGKFDPTISGVLSKFPIATIAGLFRPFLWETKNIVMLLSGIENLALLIFFLYCILKNPLSFFKLTLSNPLVLFCLSFAVIFAFSVAVSTSNFGALVRLRIPMLPFLVSGLIVIYFNNKAGAEYLQESAPENGVGK